MASEPLAPGSVIGILGGGQLGRMMAIAAARLGFRTHIFEPGAAPAADVSAAHVQASYDDGDALDAFARACDVVTYEFENVPLAAVKRIGSVAPVRPGALALDVAQDRAAEKRFISEAGIKVAPWHPVDDAAGLDEAISEIGLPAILKTRRLGYDGKGQARLHEPEDNAAAWTAVGGAASVLERMIGFEREISVIGARALDGQVVCFDPGENLHRDGILHTTTVPAAISARLRTDAVLLAGRLLNALDYVGVLGVEMFVTSEGLLVNEIAPRVHNSGHWTIEACVVDQFEQHVRAIAGWPLGDGSRHSDAVMTNLIGAEANDWPKLSAEGGGLHLYGKAEARPGRKMGHVTRLMPRR